MALKSLNQLRWLHMGLLALVRAWHRHVRGVRMGNGSRASLAARLRQRRKGLIAVGPETLIAFEALILTHDPVTGADMPVSIGGRCFIGGGCTILPGVTVGDESIVAAGAVVMTDVPPRSVVAGNPARVIRSGIKVRRFGRLEGADDKTRALYGKVMGDGG